MDYFDFLIILILKKKFLHTDRQTFGPIEATCHRLKMHSTRVFSTMLSLPDYWEIPLCKCPNTQSFNYSLKPHQGHNLVRNIFQTLNILIKDPQYSNIQIFEYFSTKISTLSSIKTFKYKWNKQNFTYKYCCIITKAHRQKIFNSRILKHSSIKMIKHSSIEKHT